jgi:hypothetical protein
MWISSIKTIVILSMQIIGPALELTFALTRSSKKYLELTRSLCLLHPAPTSLPMLPENMPYYCGSRIIPTQSSTDPYDDGHCQAIISTLLVNNCHGLCHLSNIPVQFREFEKAIPSSACPANNNNVPCYAQQVLQLGRAVYSLSRRTFCLNHPI